MTSDRAAINAGAPGVHGAPSSHAPAVDVVIAARDAAATIATTITSLLDQTHRRWQAIVVDDGSTDGTGAIALGAAGGDPRLTVVRQAPGGVSAARNAGVHRGDAPWVAFLDADDWWDAHHLASLLAATGDGVELVHTGWYRSPAPGERGDAAQGPDVADLFPVLADRPAFAVHAVLVARRTLRLAGDFDVDLAVCEDWDLWQRVARAGARAALVPGASAGYRTNPGAASADPGQLLRGAMEVTARGHRPDPRVAAPAPAHAAGAAPAALPAAQARHLAWCAGLALWRDLPTAPLLATWPHRQPVALDPDELADLLVGHPTELSGRTAAGVARAWDVHARGVTSLLDELARTFVDPTLAPRGLVRIGQRLLAAAPGARGPIGPVAAATLDVERPLEDRRFPDGTSRLRLAVVAAGQEVGTVVVPVVDGAVTAGDLADAVAVELAWPLLGALFGATVYRQLRVDGGSVTRGDVVLADRRDPVAPSDLHDLVGWTVLLQELWGLPIHDASAFYGREEREGDGHPRPAPEPPEPSTPAPTSAAPWSRLTAVAERLAGHRPRLEVSAAVPATQTWEGEVEVALGGSPLGVVTLDDGVSTTADLRIAVIAMAGFELCRVAVREGVLGRPLTDHTPLRERLAERAARRPAARRGLVLGRADPHLLDAATSRRAALPAAAAPALLELASLTGQRVLRRPGRTARYAPDLLPRGASHRHDASPPGPGRGTHPSDAARPVPAGEALRNHFDALFQRAQDPWEYDNAYEVEKYERTLSLLPGRPARALELACAEGHFTQRLASRVGELLATDISATAVARTAARCAGLASVQTRTLDLLGDDLPTGLDLVVCSEVLYYLPDRPALGEVAQKLRDALRDCGHLLTTHAHLVVDDPDAPGFDWDHPFGAKEIAAVLAATPGLHLVRELRTPLYRVCLLQRRDLPPDRPPEVRHEDRIAPLRPVSAAQVRWHGGGERRGGHDTVPILMYHRVCEGGHPWSRRYRVTPAELEEQLRHLRSAGYRSIDLDTWEEARRDRRPLPGRRVVLTFDDGYRDVLTTAWPLVRAYGFDACVFLVTDHMGGVNAWDERYGEDVPLLRWDEARRLEEEGVRFGNHTCRHDPVTALDLPALATDLARSRAALERELARPLAALAYPYGDLDQAVLPLVAATGHRHALTCRPGPSRMRDGPLLLPRIEVQGGAGLASFVAALPR